MSTTTPRGRSTVPVAAAVAADTRTSTIVVAASNSLDPTLAPPLYRCTGVADNVEMNAALVAAAAVNGRVELLEGDYNTILTISVAINVTLVGNGWGSVINFNAGGNAITVAGDNVKLRDFKIVIVAGAGAGGTRPNGVYITTRTNVEITHLWLVGDETEADDGSNLRQCGIVFYITCFYSKVIGCTIQDFERNGITIDATFLNDDEHILVEGNIILSNLNHGIYVNNSKNNIIVGNECTGNTLHGIGLLSASDNTVTGNTCSENTQHGIRLNASTGNTVTGNVCSDNFQYGIELDASLRNTVTGNNVSSNANSGIYMHSASNINTLTGNLCYDNVHGIYLTDSHHCTIAGNNCVDNTQNGIYIQTSGAETTVTGNTCSENARNGIFLTFSTKTTVTGNTCFQNDRHGILLDVASDNIIMGNICNENDLDNTGTYDGICIEDDSDDNLVMGNICNDNDRWGISIGIAADDCVGNWVKNNVLRGNTSGPFQDSGTDTKLATLQADFVHAVGGVFVDPVINTSPGGIDLDADGEIAMCHIKLPPELQLVVRIQIWAYSNVIEAANNMLLQINVHGAASSELWNTNAIDVASHPSEETGAIIVGDVIHWIIDATDDADVAALAACDKLEILAVGEAAAAPDIATDGLFGVALIEYV